MSRECETAKLTTWQWLSLIGTIAAAAAAGVSVQYRMHLMLDSRMDTLDDKWQRRTLTLQKELRTDLEGIRRSIPPDWFRAMVERNQRDISEIEKRMVSQREWTELMDMIRAMQKDNDK